MKQVKYLVMTALCVALGVVLPVTLHAIPNAGSILLPMHIPVLLCGLVCGPVYGLACGILAPLLSSLITSMPPMAMPVSYTHLPPRIVCQRQCTPSWATSPIFALLIWRSCKRGPVNRDLSALAILRYRPWCCQPVRRARRC